MAYQTKKESVKRFIETYIIPAVKKKDLDYNKVMMGISSELNIDIKIVNEVLQSFIETNKIKEVRILTIPNDQISEFLQELRKQDLEIHEAEKEMKKIEESVKKGVKKK